ncbi:MAG: hypothetical protein JSV64_07945 [Candidatus Bathyarchaeota archaeon]|jgi:predicted transcriptional regulator|nr:MAG: hypothetical protein JSV64_07945 [Candidatus Bathyarchaeota archaeon]
MPRSKLEKYLSILENLVPAPQRLEKLSYITSIECRALNQCLDFLMSHKLVEARSSKKNKDTYAITERGLAVFKTLQAQKYFHRLRKILPTIEEAYEVAPLLSTRTGGSPEDEI